MSQLSGTELLILDDFAIAPLTASQRNDFMELIEDRHGLRSTLVASQLPVEHWHEYLAEATSPMRSSTGCCTTPTDSR